MGQSEEPRSHRLTVDIFGDTYPLRTDGDPEEVRKLAAFVDKMMRTSAKKTRSLSTQRIAVLTAMELAEEYFKLKEDYDELVKLIEE